MLEPTCCAVHDTSQPSLDCCLDVLQDPACVCLLISISTTVLILLDGDSLHLQQSTTLVSVQHKPAVCGCTGLFRQATPKIKELEHGLYSCRAVRLQRETDESVVKCDTTRYRTGGGMQNHLYMTVKVGWVWVQGLR